MDGADSTLIWVLHLAVGPKAIQKHKKGMCVYVLRRENECVFKKRIYIYIYAKKKIIWLK